MTTPTFGQRAGLALSRREYRWKAGRELPDGSGLQGVGTAVVLSTRPGLGVVTRQPRLPPFGATARRDRAEFHRLPTEVLPVRLAGQNRPAAWRALVSVAGPAMGGGAFRFRGARAGRWADRPWWRYAMPLPTTTPSGMKPCGAIPSGALRPHPPVAVYGPPPGSTALAGC